MGIHAVSDTLPLTQQSLFYIPLNVHAFFQLLLFINFFLLDSDQEGQIHSPGFDKTKLLVLVLKI